MCIWTQFRARCIYSYLYMYVCIGKMKKCIYKMSTTVSKQWCETGRQPGCKSLASTAHLGGVGGHGGLRRSTSQELENAVNSSACLVASPPHAMYWGGAGQWAWPWTEKYKMYNWVTQEAPPGRDLESSSHSEWFKVEFQAEGKWSVASCMPLVRNSWFVPGLLLMATEKTWAALHNEGPSARTPLGACCNSIKNDELSPYSILVSVWCHSIGSIL